MDERELILAIQEGGEALEKAMRSLYEDQEIRKQVFRFVKDRKGSIQDAEDVFQDGIRNLMLSIRAGRYRGEGSLKAYLFGTCRNLWFRRFDRLSRQADPEREMPVQMVETDPEILLLNREQEQVLAGFLNNIGEKCREVLERWKMGYSMKEIAAAVGYKSEGVARKKKHQCLKKLIEALESAPEYKRLLREP